MLMVGCAGGPVSVEQIDEANLAVDSQGGDVTVKNARCDVISLTSAASSSASGGIKVIVLPSVLTHLYVFQFAPFWKYVCFPKCMNMCLYGIHYRDTTPALG